MSELEIGLVLSPGLKSQPDSEGDGARDDRGGDGHPSNRQRSLAGDEFSTNESSRLLPSQEGQTSVTQLVTSLPQPGDPGSGPGPVPGPTNKGSKRAASLYVNGGTPSSCVQSVPGSLPPPPPVCKSPGARPEKMRLSSTPSVCTGGSYKSAASQIPAAASDDVCATLLLSCLFCQFSDCCQLLPALCLDWLCCCLCLPCQAWGAHQRDRVCDCRCGCQADYSVFDACQQTSECLDLALEISELCYH
ncbi:myoD family inhibitor-like isoform X2 [Heptranchias perlo]|uniref:myoD family inhibitor-like isoform X2 n=1 Tax=Heptranchias perlo TaxID=212740 RepID=UPI00355A047D